MRLAAALLTLALAGCAHGPELTVLVGPKRIENNVEPALTLMLIQRFGEHGACGWAHSSEPGKGWPFNDEPEMVLDGAGCGVRYGGKAR
jgi:hypothetical protein